MVVPSYGALAQLVERHDGIVEASGSRPLRSSVLIRKWIDNSTRLLEDLERLGVVLNG